MVIFESNPGRVIRLADAGLQAQARTINFAPKDPLAIRYNSQRSIITRVMLSAKVNVQFLHTIGNQIYIYVFGDRVGRIALSGLAFGAPCEEQGSLVSNYGSELMYLWYKTHRASARRDPLRLFVGDTAIEGFVTDFDEDVVDAASSLVQWTVQMALLPVDPVVPEQLPGPIFIIPGEDTGEDGEEDEDEDEEDFFAAAIAGPLGAVTPPALTVMEES